MANDSGEDAPPPTPPPGTGPTQQSWRSLTVGLAAGIAVVLLVIVIAVAVGGNDNKPTAAPPATATTATSALPATTALTGATSTAPPSTRKATPLPIVAADDRRVVVLDESGSAPPRTLFDLGPSRPTDLQPPLLGGVSLAGDGRNAYFDVVGTAIPGVIRRVSVASGGPAEVIGDGVGPSVSPDGTMLAVIEAPEPDVPATLLLRPLQGGASRRVDLGDSTCGNVAWSPQANELAVDTCSQGEPVSVLVVDVASAGVRPLTPPDGVTWSVPAFKPDGALTLVEQRGPDAVVVTLTADRTKVASSGLRRTSTTIRTIDWSAAGDLLVCDADGIVVAAIGGTKPQQVATGYTAGAW